MDRLMDRRRFLQSLAIASAAVNALPGAAAGETAVPVAPPATRLDETEGAASELDVEGHTLVCTFRQGAAEWKVYEDLRSREGVMTLAASSGHNHVLAKSAEANFPGSGPPYLGLKLADIGMAGPDLLADRLLRDGDPDPQQVKSAAPPMGSAPPVTPYERPAWNTIVGTKECMDTMPVYPSGSTRTYHPVQYFPEITQAAAGKRYEGLLGGWMPAVRKVFPAADGDSSGGHYEVVVFGDVSAHDKFIVQTWHRTAHVQDGKIVKVQYGYSYPSYPPAREDPSPEAFYAALLEFTLYWQKQLRDFAPVALPDQSLADMARYAFAKELMVRPGGVYPKYGAVDRDYYGPEYDGFQDIFTSALYTNLEWGRFEMAGQVLDNYYSDFVDDKGMINMRGPETAQFGLTLSLIARYFNYTQDRALLQKHRRKFEATAKILTDMHDESLKLAKDNVGYGLIHGWSESDSCLAPKPETWWLPYFANSAFAARGLKDLARTWKDLGWGNSGLAATWSKHSDELSQAVVTSMRKDIRHDMTPAYIGTYPGTKLTFRESLTTEHPSPQGWPHRPYAELLQADMLPAGPCKYRHRLHARLWRYYDRRCRQCRAATCGGTRHSGFHLLRICPDAAATRSRRKVPALPVFAPVPRSHARQLDGRRGLGNQGRYRVVLHSRAADDSAAGPVDAGAGRFGRRSFVSWKRIAANMAHFRQEDTDRAGSDAMGKGKLQRCCGGGEAHSSYG